MSIALVIGEQKRPQERIKYAGNRGYGLDWRCAIAELTVKNRKWKIENRNGCSKSNYRYQAKRG